jgi:hypothetical protein
MTVITRAQVPVTALPSTGNGSLEQLFAYAAAALRFHTLAMERIQLLDSNGAISSYRPCSVFPVETPDKKMMLYVQGVVPLVADIYTSEATAIWADVEQYSQSALITSGYTA